MKFKLLFLKKNDDSKPAAHINCKIIFYWSDFQFYDEKRKKEEKKVNSLQKAVNKLRKYQKGKEEYKRLDNECRKYQQEKVNKEGFCENAKVTVIIEDVDIKSKIEGIQSISIKLIYNNEERETEFISGDDNHQINQKFEL